MGDALRFIEKIVGCVQQCCGVCCGACSGVCCGAVCMWCVLWSCVSVGCGLRLDVFL